MLGVKKIGIATFNRTHNYGSLLQSYAFMKVLRDKLGTSAEFINFSNDEQREMYAYLNRMNSFKNLIKNFLIIINWKLTQGHFRDFNKFQNDYLVHSEGDFRNSEDLKLVNFDYDVIVSGSDQVWNTAARDFDEFYFLNFATNAKKVAYAVSFGGTNFVNDMKTRQKYLRWINQFDNISVRERNSQSWLQSVEIPHVDIMPDPTLLLTPDEYSNVIDEKPIFEGEYIFYYGFKYDREINKAVKKMGEALGLPVVVVDGRKYSIYGLRRYGFKVSPQGGPKAFLNIMKNAKYSVTQSFHGTVFSVLMNVPFLYMTVPGVKSDDDRASFLLKQMGMSDQMVGYDELTDKIDRLENLDFSDATNRIAVLRDKGLKYIRHNIID